MGHCSASFRGWPSGPPVDESTTPRLRHLLEKHNLAAQILVVVNDLLCKKGLLPKAGTVVNAKLIDSPSLSRSASGEREPEMQQGKRGKQWHFGIKARFGVVAESSVAQTV